MRPVFRTMDLDNVDPNGVFQDQTTGGAGAITLNGAGVVDGEWVSPDGMAKRIGLESAGNISGVNFTIIGFQDEQRHIALSETLAGPNAGTVETTEYFYVITSITVDGAVGTNTEGGNVDEAVDAIIPLNWRGNVVGMTIVPTGTIDYTVEKCQNDIQNDPNPFTWSDHDDAALVNATTLQSGNYIAIPMATRIKVNSYSSGAKLEYTITHTNAN